MIFFQHFYTYTHLYRHADMKSLMIIINANDTKLLQMQAFPLIEPHTIYIMLHGILFDAYCGCVCDDKTSSESMHELKINRKLDARMICIRHITITIDHGRCRRNRERYFFAKFFVQDDVF